MSRTGSENHYTILLHALAGAIAAGGCSGSRLQAIAGILEPALVPLRWIALRAAELVADAIE